jgi:hypothetical protein
MILPEGRGWGKMGDRHKNSLDCLPDKGLQQIESAEMLPGLLEF